MVIRLAQNCILFLATRVLFKLKIAHGATDWIGYKIKTLYVF
jgi:hypothetical protein